MYAVYLCGPTDCFLHALFMVREEAVCWAEQRESPDHYIIKRWDSLKDVDTTDTGWEQL